MNRVRAIAKDALPGLIAAGVLSATEQLLFHRATWQVPLFGLVAAGTVYAADHRLRATGKGSALDWLGILSASAGLLYLALATPWFSLLPLLGFVLLSLGYVLHLPRTSFRLQDHPWIRVFMIALGWAAVPLILRGIPRTPLLGGWMLGNAGLFFSAVLYSDLLDAEEDLAAGRKTPSQILRPNSLRILISLGYLVAIGGYLLARQPIYWVAPMMGFGVLPCLKHSPFLPYTDLLLLWPGIIALTSAF